MSGAMMQPQAQPQGQPQIPPQLAAMLMQRLQQQRQAMPQGQMPPQQMQRPQGPPPAPIPPPQGASPGLAAFGRAAQAQPGAMGAPQGQQMGLRPQEAASMGRFGDTVLGHLTPGEIVINPRMLPPQLMQTIMQAFQQAGVDPRSMIVGSPAAPHNPQTGVEEHNGIFSSILPMLLGIGGAIAAPELLGPLGLADTLGAGAASSIGGGIGSAAGSLLGGGNTGQALTAGLGSAAGNALAGGLGGGSSTPTTDASNFASPTTTPFGNPANATLATQYGIQGNPGASTGLGGSMLAGAQPSGVNPPGPNPGTIGGGGGLGSIFGGGGGGDLTGGQMALRGAGSALGGLAGQALSPATPNLSLPQGSIPYHNPAGPNPQSGAPGRPTFTNYNPFTAVTGQPYNFYPPPG